MSIFICWLSALLRVTPSCRWQPENLVWSDIAESCCRENDENWDPQIIKVLKLVFFLVLTAEICPKDADGMTNSVDHDQTAVCNLIICLYIFVPIFRIHDSFFIWVIFCLAHSTICFHAIIVIYSEEEFAFNAVSTLKIKTADTKLALYIINSRTKARRKFPVTGCIFLEYLFSVLVLYLLVSAM